ncbi:MAG: biotin/lipoyl-containing protein, partial [Parvularculaceae bacterium]
ASSAVVRDGDIIDMKAGVARRFIDLTFAPAAASGAAGDEVRAPMAGVVTGVAVKAGEAVKRGQTLATIEAMKMEHRLSAPRDGVVDAVSVVAGAQVAIRALLVSLEPGASGKGGEA